MKKIIEVLILVGGLMMVVSCANPSSVSDDVVTQNTNTEVQNGGTTDPQNTNNKIYFVKDSNSNRIFNLNYNGHTGSFVTFNSINEDVEIINDFNDNIGGTLSVSSCGIYNSSYLKITLPNFYSDSQLPDKMYVNIYRGTNNQLYGNIVLEY